VPGTAFAAVDLVTSVKTQKPASSPAPRAMASGNWRPIFLGFQRGGRLVATAGGAFIGGGAARWGGDARRGPSDLVLPGAINATTLGRIGIQRPAASLPFWGLALRVTVEGCGFRIFGAPRPAGGRGRSAFTPRACETIGEGFWRGKENRFAAAPGHRRAATLRRAKYLRDSVPGPGAWAGPRRALRGSSPGSLHGGRSARS